MNSTIPRLAVILLLLVGNSKKTRDHPVQLRAFRGSAIRRLLVYIWWLTPGGLAKIQRRRAFPTRVTQRLQEVIRKQVGRDVGKSGTARPPWFVRLLERTTIPRRLRTRFVGVGIRPEHVKTPVMSGAHVDSR
jgi:hypothetical protein